MDKNPHKKTTQGTGKVVPRGKKEAFCLERLKHRQLPKAEKKKCHEISCSAFPSESPDRSAGRHRAVPRATELPALEKVPGDHTCVHMHAPARVLIEKLAASRAQETLQCPSPYTEPSSLLANSVEQMARVPRLICTEIQLLQHSERAYP